MNPRTEERLRAAFAAKADQVTEERLTARQRADQSFSDGSTATALPDAAAVHPGTDPTWQARWIAPALAAAAVAAVAARAQRPPSSRRQAHASTAGQPEESCGPEPDTDA